MLGEDVGIKSLAGFSPLLKKGAEIPASFADDFSTAADNQPAVTVAIFARNARAEEVRELGEITVEGIEPAERGMPRIRITVTVTSSGAVVVVARDLDTGKTSMGDFGPVLIQEE